RRTDPEARLAAALAAEYLAQLAALQGRGEDGVAWAERAVDLLGEDAPAWTTAGAVHAVTLGVAGRHAEAEAVLAGWPPIEGSSVPATSRRLGRGLVR